MVKYITKLWGIFTGLIVIGIIIYIGLLYVTSQSLSARITGIDSLKYKLSSNEVHICFIVEVNNSGIIDVDIRKLYYEVYVDGEFLGKGVEEDIVVHVGSNKIDLCLDTKPSSTLKTILHTLILKGGRANVTIKGYVSIPIKSFNVIKLWDVEILFKESVEVDVSVK